LRPRPVLEFRGTFQFGCTGTFDAHRFRSGASIAGEGFNSPVQGFGAGCGCNSASFQLHALNSRSDASQLPLAAASSAGWGHGSPPQRFKQGKRGNPQVISACDEVYVSGRRLVARGGPLPEHEYRRRSITEQPFARPFQEITFMAGHPIASPCWWIALGSEAM